MLTNAQLKKQALGEDIGAIGHEVANSPIREAVPEGILSLARDLVDGTKDKSKAELREKMAGLGLNAAEMTALRAGILREMAKTDMAAFTEYIFGWKPAAHHRVMLRALERTKGNVCIVAPPGSAKTNYVGIAGSLFQIVKDQNIRICYLSGTKEQAHRPSVMMRDTIENNANFKDLFPHIRPNHNLGWAENRWFIEREVLNLKDPTMKSVGAGNQIEGSRVDHFNWDDLCTRENQTTAETRRGLNEWVIQVALTRLRPGGRIWNVMTRYGRGDIMNLIEEMGNFTILRMPALGFWESIKDSIEIEEMGLPEALKATGIDTMDAREFLMGELNPESVNLRSNNHGSTAGISKNKGQKGALLRQNQAVECYHSTLYPEAALFELAAPWSCYAEKFDNEKASQKSTAQPHTAPLHGICPMLCTSVVIEEGAAAEIGPFGGVKGGEAKTGGVDKEGEEAERLESPVGGHEPPRGGSLWPGYFTRQDYLKIWRLSPELFEQTYQGLPTLRSGAIFKHEWWQYYTRGEGNSILPEPARIVTLSSDTAFGTKNKNDWSVNIVAALGVSGILYLLDLYCKKVEFPQLVRDTTGLIKRWAPDRVLIENRGSGISLIQTLSLETLAPVEAINPDMDKLRRAHAVTPFVQSGNVMIPEDAIWKDDFIQQMSDFPNGTHDDMVDAFTQTVNWLIGQSLILLEGRLLQSAGGFVNAYDKGGALEDHTNGMPLFELRSFQASDPFSPRAWMDLA